MKHGIGKHNYSRVITSDKALTCVGVVLSMATNLFFFSCDCNTQAVLMINSSVNPATDYTYSYTDLKGLENHSARDFVQAE